MSIFTLILTLVIAGFVLYLVGLIPMHPTVRNIIFGVAVLLIVLWVLQQFGLVSGIGLRLR